MTRALWDELWVRTGRPRARVPPACPPLQQDATDLTALDSDPQLVGGLDQRIQRPHAGLLGVDRSQGAVGLPDQAAGGGLADQGDQLARWGLGGPGGRP